MSNISTSMAELFATRLNIHLTNTVTFDCGKIRLTLSSSTLLLYIEKYILHVYRGKISEVVRWKVARTIAKYGITVFREPPYYYVLATRILIYSSFLCRCAVVYFYRISRSTILVVIYGNVHRCRLTLLKIYSRSV